MQNLLPPVSFPAHNNVALTSCLQGDLALPRQEDPWEYKDYNYKNQSVVARTENKYVNRHKFISATLQLQDFTNSLKLIPLPISASHYGT